MNLKKLTALAVIAFFLMLVGCSEEIYESETQNQHGKSKNAISFKQFKKQTGLRDFRILKSYNTADANNREVEDDYLIDTTRIMYFAGPAGKDTYSFKIYPITKDLNPREYYNLVYEKDGDTWYEHIFKNVEKANPLPEEPKLESSEMIYSNKNAHFSLSFMEACQLIEVSFHCTGCIGVCDGCDKCVTVTVTYFPCQTGGSGTGGTGGIIIGDNGGGGSGTGIYIPNPYNVGEEDLNNPDFVLAMNVATFTRSLPTSPVNLKAIVNSRSWMYPHIVDYMRNNGGLTQENKDKVIFALGHIGPVFNLNLPNWTFSDRELLDFNGFNHLLDNPNSNGNNFIQNITSSPSTLGAVDFPNNIKFDTSFTNTKSDCSHKKMTTNQTNIYTQMLATFNTSTNVNLTMKVGTPPNGDWGITKGDPSTPNNYTITMSSALENLSNLGREVTLCHELIHAYMFNAMEGWGMLTFDANGDPYLNLSCSSTVNYNNINLNTLSVQDRFTAMLCAMNQNGTLTPQWTHELFGSTFTAATYRQEVENMIYNMHDWANESPAFVAEASNLFGANWKREISKAVSYMGLENTSIYATYLNGYSTNIPKFTYIMDIRNKIAAADNNCP